MPDTQKCTDRCRQKHCAGSTAGIIPHMCWHKDFAHSDHTSNALKDLLHICRNLFLKGQKSSLTKYSLHYICNTLHNSSLHLPSTSATSKAGPRRRHSSVPRSSGIHKVVKSLIRRFPGAPGQSCMSLTVSALIALWFVCFGSSMLAMSQV